MGTELEIFGVKQAQLLARLPDSHQDIKEKYIGKPLKISAAEMVNMYYSFLHETANEPNSGLKLLFEMRGGENCRLLGEAQVYFLADFDWQNDDIETKFESNHEGDFIFSKEQYLDILDWYISISYVYTKVMKSDFKFAEGTVIRYEQPARYLILDYYQLLSEQDPTERKEIWDWSAEQLLNLKEIIKAGDYDYIFYNFSC